MLQKLENAYLAILRFVIIAVAGLLLVVVLILGFNSFKAIQFEPEEKDITPQVTEQELIQGITKKATPQSGKANSAVSSNKESDPNLVSYERAANAIANFVEKYSEGNESVEKQQIVAITKQRAESIGDTKLTNQFALGFADTIEKTLADQSVIKQGQNTSTLDVVNKALGIFTQKFNEQIQKEKASFAAKQQEYMNKKADGIQSLYIAAGAFTAFLMIVFLSIIIRIERNLRHLEGKSVS